MQTAVLIVQIATVIVLIVSVITLKKQISKTHEWNRRKAAQDLVDHMFRIRYYELVEALEEISSADGKIIVNMNDQDQTYSDVVHDGNKKRIRQHLRPLLGFCEEIALGVRHNIYDKDLAYDYFGFLAPSIFRWSEPFIKEVRQEAEDQTIYIEMEELGREWAKRNKEEAEKARQSQRTQTKKPL